MKDHFWKVLAILAVVVMAYVGVGLQRQPAPTLVAPAMVGGVTSADDKVEMVLTSSEDGKTVYVWRYYSSKPPKYLGKSEAVLRQ